MDSNVVFDIKTPRDFEAAALNIYAYQYKRNKVYQTFCDYLKRTPDSVSALNSIPFLPIEFFKSHQVTCKPEHHDIIFTSSGTTGNLTSKHYVNDLSVYEASYLKAFGHFYGKVEDYAVLALLPAYLERKGSSLIYMVDDLIKRSKNPHSGFYLHNLDALKEKLEFLEATGQKVLLIGVSFALLDLIETHRFNLKNTIVMETGGMKGRRKELIRTELHELLKAGFGVSAIHSEYGMTELLSQGYSKGDGLFYCPPWMKIVTRDTEDPLSIQQRGKTGGINVIDLANVYSCSFIATQDLGKTHNDNSFEVIGRFDNSDIRGCNLMAL